MIKYQVVLGLGFGDEGKGATVDHLCSQSSHNTIVVRFSGGHQAGHTVVADGKRHVFSNFGSGSLRGVPTYWSKFCTVDPIALENEHKVLLQKGVKPTIYIDPDCPITTPYEKAANRLCNSTLAHGTCGVGFGKTIEREEKGYHLTFGDLFHDLVLKIKMDCIKEYYYQKLGHEFVVENFKNLSRFYDACKSIKSWVGFGSKEMLKSYLNVIFEGSQGVLLDKDVGFFPHVTRANTTMKNVLELTDGYIHETYLVTRAYLTRHGNGPMSRSGVDPSEFIFDYPYETNQTHRYQGEFKKDLLDVSLMDYAMGKSGALGKKVLVVTCFEHMKKLAVGCDGYATTYNSPIDFASDLSDGLNTDSFITCSDHNFSSVRW